ncbi:thioesterase family protein [Altererythrobacter arenosus]|uniref:Thioesterase family protein n=1 Tax=Altererythrobacter arenosus TaxID=3032592 RepID=A0ABY8G059_9SPHN|nr:acyl-CoA thioesterase domain-containing protein [Altererythrobacter sp. CAU 1644]WFL77629.1 thioesterase family protein [Altererythrobacter sp. CAU 1644]
MSDMPTDPQSLVDALVRLLTVRKQDEHSFSGMPQRGGVGRVFGGQVIAQALQAAQATVEDGKQAHSLHAYFLRGGKEGPPIHYRVEADFDGRSFANRRVVASQEDEDGTSRPILNLTASFQLPESGLEHGEADMPDVPPPEDLPPDMELRREYVAKAGISGTARDLMLRPRPIDMRTSDKLHWMNAEPREPRAHSWFKTVAPLPDDPALHRAVISYASDYTLLGTSALPHGLSWMRGELVGASLDHAIWFHREARADEWLLYATESPWSGGGRGYNRGHIFNRSGELVASVAQEGMMRKRVKPR